MHVAYSEPLWGNPLDGRPGPWVVVFHGMITRDIATAMPPRAILHAALLAQAGRGAAVPAEVDELRSILREVKGCDRVFGLTCGWDELQHLKLKDDLLAFLEGDDAVPGNPVIKRLLGLDAAAATRLALRFALEIGREELSRQEGPGIPIDQLLAPALEAAGGLCEAINLTLAEGATTDREEWLRLVELALAEMDLGDPAHLGGNLPLSDFAEWQADRLRFKHNWLDHMIVDLRDSASSLPEKLGDFWAARYDLTTAWLDRAVSSLSPEQVIDLVPFSRWPEPFVTKWKNELARRFKPAAETKVAEALAALKKADEWVRQRASSARFIPTEKERQDLASLLVDVRDPIDRLPRSLSWPSPSRPPQPALPVILMIDDLFGRPNLLSEDIRTRNPAAKVAWQSAVNFREQFCRRYSLTDGEAGLAPLPKKGKGKQTSSPVDDKDTRPHWIGRIHFCPAQRFDEGSGGPGTFFNKLQPIRDALHPDGTLHDGTPVSLILVDVTFNHGVLGEDGWARENSSFGLDRVVPFLREYARDVPVIVMTDASREEVIQAANRENLAFLHKTDSALPDLLERIVCSGRATPAQLRAALGIAPDIIAEDRKTLDVYLHAYWAAVDPTEPTILILGESGSGKEHLAEYIHAKSRGREQRPYVPTNCSNLIKQDHAQSSLFGYYRYAYSGAGDADVRGKFHEADEGTLFLDEVGDLPDSVQAMLLRTLAGPVKNRPLEPLGNKPQKPNISDKVDVRVVCATDQRTERFRTAFFRRIAAVRLNLPPLRERRDDILPLARHLIAKRLGRPGITLDPGAEDHLLRLRYPGNVGELENVLRNALVGKGGRNILKSSDIERACRMLNTDDQGASIPGSTPSPSPDVTVSTPIRSTPGMPRRTVSDGLAEVDTATMQATQDRPEFSNLPLPVRDAINYHLNNRLAEALAILAEWLRRDTGPSNSDPHILP